ncbi:MAG: hypothetical protein LUD15_05845 [Bacteroides sp.]|nr:hypothetical protein [Bacteroides sp.]
MEKVDILKGAFTNALFIEPGAWDVCIVVKLKRGLNQTALANQKQPLNVTYVTPLGYSVYTDFYHPKYETPQQKNNSKRDLRSTIYWNPNLTFNKEGKATLEYYTPDGFTGQYIVIEGVDKNGDVYRKTINR